VPDDGDPIVGRQNRLQRLDEQAMVVGQENSNRLLRGQDGLR
jgi:hypothetical protein